MPPIFYSLKFWEAVAWILAGVLALLAQFDVIPANYAFDAVAILAAIKAILKFFGVNPELKAKGFK